MITGILLTFSTRIMKLIIFKIHKVVQKSCLLPDESLGIHGWETLLYPTYKITNTPTPTHSHPRGHSHTFKYLIHIINNVLFKHFGLLIVNLLSMVKNTLHYVFNIERISNAFNQFCNKNCLCF